MSKIDSFSVKKYMALVVGMLMLSCSAQKKVSTSEESPKIEKKTYYSVVNADTTMANITIIPICRADAPVTEEKKGMTDETLRLLISEFFSTVAAIIAITSVKSD